MIGSPQNSQGGAPDMEWLGIIDMVESMQWYACLRGVRSEWQAVKGLGKYFVRGKYIIIIMLSLKKKSRVNNSLHPWSEEISLVEEWISLDSNSSRVKIHYSASEISSSSLDIHSKRSDHWRHYPRSENRVNRVIFFFLLWVTQAYKFWWCNIL